MTNSRPAAFSIIVALSMLAACSGRPAATAARTAPPTDTSPPPMAVGHSLAESPAASAQPETVTTAMEPAKDGTTVAAVWKTRTSLAGKKVTLRGKVVKYTSAVLGVNWIHIQDGSGKAADGSNDITVTSEMETKVGDVITVTGTVVLNKDLGSGYNYPVLIEHASIVNR